MREATKYGEESEKWSGEGEGKSGQYPWLDNEIELLVPLSLDHWGM